MIGLGPVVALAGYLLVSSALAGTYTGRVVGVMDGDTIKVLDKAKTLHRIRLAGVDAPEKKQPYGQRSKQQLARQVFDREVTLDCGKIDRYKREICVVLLDGQDITLAQVQSGYGWWYRQYAREQTLSQRLAYQAAELSARELRLGLWRDPSPTPPWEWRQKGRRAR